MDFINIDTIGIAKDLLGKKLIVKKDGLETSGWIVETEAYLGSIDKAAHTYNNRRTPRVESMYKLGGTVYVYQMHTHNNVNIVTKEIDNAEAVLIRAIEPCCGKDIMEIRRGRGGIELTNGPGKLCKAMGIDKSFNGTFINELLILDEINKKIPIEIVSSPRIGIPNKDIWTDALLRFYVKGNPYVSVMRKRDHLPVDKCWI
jgi:DNA-3-methyladenine glycosylase